MNSLKSKYQIRITGLNLHHVLAFFEHEKLSATQIERIDQKNLRCTLEKSDFKKFKKSALAKAFKIKIERRYGLDNFFNHCINHLGIIIGCLVCFFSITNLTNRVLAIHINTSGHTCSNGEECIFSNDNLNKLNEHLATYGITKYAKLSTLPSAREIERDLMLNFKQISGVSVTIRGVHVYIDIIEATLPTTQDQYSLIAQENGIVISIDITSGNSNVNIGDIVLKGDTLVTSKNNAPVSATIVLRSFYHDSVIYNEKQIEYKRTGKSYTINQLELYKLKTNSSKNIPFSLYESETNSRYAFLNMFLPIKINTITYYELNVITIEKPYKTMEKSIKENLTEKTRLLLPQNAEEKNVTYTTFKEGSRYRIDCYIETYLTIKK